MKKTMNKEIKIRKLAGRNLWTVRVLVNRQYEVVGVYDSRETAEREATRTMSERTGERTNMKTPDEINDEIRARVDAELPRPIGGFETDDQDQQWRDAQEARFFQLVREAQ